MRRWIGPIVSLGLLLLVHPASAGSAGVTSWSQVGRDTTHTAYNPTESVLSPATVPDLVEQWRAELGGTQWSTPVVDGSLVLQTSYDNGALSAFDRSTGTLVWQVVRGRNDPFNTPAVADGRVFATVSFSDTLHAFDEATGEVLWTLGMEGSSGAPPSVVTEGGVTTVFADGGSTVYAVDGATGTVHWSHELGFFALQATPAVANGVVYVIDYEPVLHAYDMETGEENWAAPLGPENDTPSYPVLDNGMVFVALWGEGRLFAVDEATGAEVWNKNVHAESQPSTANGVVYVHSRQSSASNLAAVEQTTGQHLWKASLGASRIYTFSDGASIANGVVYTIALGGWVLAFDEVDGSLLWRSRIPNGAGDMPAVVDGVVYAAAGHKLFAFGLESER